MFRTIPNALVFYPSDAVSTEHAVKLAANYNGIVFIKGGRNNHPILYSNEEEFKIGGSKFLRHSDNDVITIVSGGAPLFEVLKVVEKFKSEGVNIRVVDLFCVKPVDKALLAEAAAASKGLVYVVEDNYYEGGLGGK
jgi:transketolase